MNMKSFVVVVLCLLFLNVSIAGGQKGDSCSKDSNCGSFTCSDGYKPGCLVNGFGGGVCACIKS